MRAKKRRAENERSFGFGVVYGICATKDDAVKLIEAATKALAGGVGFVRDDKVGMF